MAEKSCSFSGHRAIPKNELPYIRAMLSVEILKLINSGTRSFICGGALGFDTIAAQMVLDYREIFHDISLVLCLPCHSQAERWNNENQKKYNEILSRANKVFYASEEYNKNCMHLRNRMMVQASEHLIVYLKKSCGGTFYTANYAEKLGKNVIFI